MAPSSLYQTEHIPAMLPTPELAGVSSKAQSWIHITFIPCSLWHIIAAQKEGALIHWF